MGQLSPILRGGVDFVSFWCPGCGAPHSVRTEGPSAWAYNGSAEAPTFQPSILVSSGHYGPGGDEHCWCRFNAERIAKGEPPSGFSCNRCHSFVTEGHIQFLGDCSHALAGQTVDLPPWPNWEDR